MLSHTVAGGPAGGWLLIPIRAIGKAHTPTRHRRELSVFIYLFTPLTSHPGSRPLPRRRLSPHARQTHRRARCQEDTLLPSPPARALARRTALSPPPATPPMRPACRSQTTCRFGRDSSRFTQIRLDSPVRAAQSRRSPERLCSAARRAEPRTRRRRPTRRGGAANR